MLLVLPRLLFTGALAAEHFAEGSAVQWPDGPLPSIDAAEMLVETNVPETNNRGCCLRVPLQAVLSYLLSGSFGQSAVVYWRPFGHAFPKLGAM